MNTNAFEEIKELTQINAVGDAYQLAAEALGFTDIAKQFAIINQEHRRIGELTWELNYTRYAVYEKLIAEAKAIMSQDEYEKFYMLF